MQGVTTAIVVFIFVCIGYPQLVKNRSQFNTTLGLVLLIVLIDGIGRVFTSLTQFSYFIDALLQIGAILLLVMSTGGKSLSELSGEMVKTIDVIRRGGETETLIVTPQSEQPKPRAGGPPPPPRSKPPDKSSIPLD